MFAVLVICHVAAGVEKVDALNFAWLLRYMSHVMFCYYALSFLNALFETLYVYAFERLVVLFFIVKMLFC